MLQIAKMARNCGFRVFTCCPDSRTNRERKDDDTLFIGNRLGRYLHILLARFFGIDGFFSIISTLSFIKRMEKEKCDLIHLHNIHGNYINYPILFTYIKKKNIPVVWTLHDCWTFTGRCPYFDMINCFKWKSGCCKCKYSKDAYPQSKLDNTRLMWLVKRKLFTNIKKCTLVTPSMWLSNLVHDSFLNVYSVETIYNGIDLNVFRPMKSDLRQRFGLEAKKVILGVAFEWERRKGLDIFVELSKVLTNDYKIILVGTNDYIDKFLPSSILSIHRTQSQEELAQFYSIADVFVNPTREEVWGMVNIESLACGTPVVSFDTGGCPECVIPSCGAVVKKNDVECLVKEIDKICKQNSIKRENCLERAQVFDRNDQYRKYVDLYKKMIEEKL